MKALTVWQPWASLISLGWKRYEFRSHARVPRSIIGGRIAIHAGARKPVKAEIWDLLRRLDSEMSAIDPAAREWLEQMQERPHELPLACITCTALIGKPINAREIAEREGWINDSNREATFNFAWPLFEVKPVPNIPARGAQGWWDLPHCELEEWT